MFPSHVLFFSSTEDAFNPKDVLVQSHLQHKWRQHGRDMCACGEMSWEGETGNKGEDSAGKHGASVTDVRNKPEFQNDSFLKQKWNGTVIDVSRKPLYRKPLNQGLFVTAA